MDMYRADCSGYEQGIETGFNHIIFAADSCDDAIQQAARFLENRCRNLDLKAGCIKVSRFPVRRISEDGSYKSTSPFPFFEWKCDTSPYGLKDLIDSMDARVASR